MKTTAIAVASAAVLALGLAGGAGAASRPAPKGATGHAAVQQKLEALVRAGAPGALAESQEGAASWFGSAGAADRRTGRPAGRSDRFRVGSITKMFTATVIMQLAAEGRLRLDDTVDRWLPGTVHGNGNDGRRITIRQLLDHTSGLYDYTSDPEFQRSHLTGRGFLLRRFERVTPQRLLDIALAHRPYFAPGSSWHYSNTNYLLAGLVIEKATGGSYAEAVQRRIIRPLGLTGTVVPGTDPAMPQPYVHGYFKPSSSAGMYDVSRMSPTVPGPAGEIISTAGDLDRFIGALLGGRLLPREYLAQMLTTRPVTAELSSGPGLFEQRLSCGTRVWGHAGLIQGYMSYTVATRDGGHRLTVSVNGDWLDPTALNQVLDAEFCP